MTSSSVTNSVSIKLSTVAIVSSLVGDMRKEQSLSPSQFISKYWNLYCSTYPSNQNLNGKVFEELLAICLIRNLVLPFYMQAKVAFIPNVNYDFVIYTKEVGPIALSAKTSLRERWKQADLEALALKNIHRASQTHVITLDHEAVKARRVDSDQYLGINSFVLANTSEIDTLFQRLSKLTITLAPKVDIVTSNTLVTRVNFIDRFSIKPSK